MIEVRDLTVSYFGKRALYSIAFMLPLGKSTGVIGPNGAGKSTLLKAMLGVIKKDSGSVFINGTPLNDLRRKVAYVAQKSEIDLSFPITVFDTILTGTYPRLPLFYRPTKKDREIVLSCIERVGLKGLEKRQIGNLSGGQLQRVFIARALVQDADFFFLDEPFAGIDIASEKIISSIFQDLKESGKTIVTVHHDLHKVVEYFDNIVMLNERLVVCDTTKKAFITANIQKTYGESLGSVSIKGVDT